MIRVIAFLFLLTYTLTASDAFARSSKDISWASPQSNELLPSNGTAIVFLAGSYKDAVKKKYYFRNGEEKIRASIVWKREGA